MDDNNGSNPATTATVIIIIIDLLLRAGARLDARLRNGQTALHVAASRGNVHAVRALLQSNDNTNDEDDDDDDRRHNHFLFLTTTTTDRRGWTALHLAAYHGHVDVVQYFLSLPSTVLVDNLVDATTTHEGHSAFFVAATTCETVGRTTVLRLLVEYQQQQRQRRRRRRNCNLVDRPDAWGRTALYHAVTRRDTAMI
eukprot:scaffold43795_cov214-Amphora_coffeaeformis.AAC.1